LVMASSSSILWTHRITYRCCLVHLLFSYWYSFIINIYFLSNLLYMSRFTFWWLGHRLKDIFWFSIQAGLEQKESAFSFIIFLWPFVFCTRQYFTQSHWSLYCVIIHMITAA
jgi:hypothetical protein